jgi:hypothetical protein
VRIAGLGLAGLPCAPRGDGQPVLVVHGGAEWALPAAATVLWLTTLAPSVCIGISAYRSRGTDHR